MACSKFKHEWSGLAKRQILLIAVFFIPSVYVQYKVHIWIIIIILLTKPILKFLAFFLKFVFTATYLIVMHSVRSFILAAHHNHSRAWL